MSGSKVYIVPGVQIYDATMSSIIYSNIMLFDNMLFMKLWHNN